MKKHIHKFTKVVLTDTTVKTTILLCKCKETQSIVTENIKTGQVIMKIGYFPDQGNIIKVSKLAVDNR